MFRGKPRTVGELYENIMKKGTRKQETGRPTYHFYITPDSSWKDNWIEVDDANLNKYKKLRTCGKFHDDWDEYVCFQVDITQKEKNYVSKNDNKRK